MSVDISNQNLIGGDDFSEDELMLFLQKLEKEKKLNQFFKIMKVIVDDEKDDDYEFNEEELKHLLIDSEDDDGDGDESDEDNDNEDNKEVLEEKEEL
jgi:hypothetical protein